MPWVRLEDEFPDHPKVVAAGPGAAWLYVTALCYCNRMLTDGFIAADKVSLLAATGRRLAVRLVTAGLWTQETRDGVVGYVVHDYHVYQPTREEVEAEREAKRRAGRLGGQAAARARATAAATAGAQAGALAESKPVPVPVPQKKLVKDPPAVADTPGDGAPVAETTRFLKEFERLYAHHRQGAAYFVRWPEYAPIVKRLLTLHAYDRLVKHAKILLTTNESWIAETDRGIPILATKINWLEERLTAWEAKQRETS